MLRTLSFSVLARLSSDSLWAISLTNGRLTGVSSIDVCSLISLLWAQGLSTFLVDIFIGTFQRPLQLSKSKSKLITFLSHHLQISSFCCQTSSHWEGVKTSTKAPLPSCSSKQLVAGPLFPISEFCPSSFLFLIRMLEGSLGASTQSCLFQVHL